MTTIFEGPPAAEAPSRRAHPELNGLRALSWRLGGVPGVVGLLLLLVLVLLAIGASIIAVHSPVAVNPLAVLKKPSGSTLFGTDDLGRDVFSRVLYGLRTSLGVAFGSVALAVLVGVPIGLLAGYIGGSVDTLLMRSVDLLLAFPALLLAIVIVAILGAGEGVTILAVGVIFVPIMARVVRSAVVVVRGHPYVKGARARGASHLRVMVTHIVPNVLPPTVVQASILTGFAILIEASLAFLGLGVQPPTPDLGSMLAEGGNFATQAPWIEVAPGVFLALAILAFNLTGRGLQRGLGVHEAEIR
ncbi:MAG: ABC transporter permease [Actinomycetota bacterium]|nr:ABC transporter permease [Actinomycetota bacterium]